MPRGYGWALTVSATILTHLTDEKTEPQSIQVPWPARHRAQTQGSALEPMVLTMEPHCPTGSTPSRRTQSSERGEQRKEDEKHGGAKTGREQRGCGASPSVLGTGEALGKLTDLLSLVALAVPLQSPGF